MKRLLIVDDDMEFLQLLASILEGQFEVYTATGVKAAIQVLNTSVMDAVCSDYNMRDGTGLDLLKQLYKDHSEISFLLMSGADDPSLVCNAQSYGAIFVSKTDSTLLGKIRSF